MLHLLDGLIDEVFMSDPGKTYIQKGTRISKISSEDVNKSAAIATFERDSETRLEILSRPKAPQRLKKNTLTS